MPGFLVESVALVLFLDVVNALTHPNPNILSLDEDLILDLELQVFDNSSLKSSHNMSIFSSSSSSSFPSLITNFPLPPSTHEKLFLWLYLIGKQSLSSSSPLADDPFGGEAVGDKCHKGGESIVHGKLSSIMGKLKSSVAMALWLERDENDRQGCCWGWRVGICFPSFSSTARQVTTLLPTTKIK